MCANPQAKQVAFPRESCLMYHPGWEHVFWCAAQQLSTSVQTWILLAEGGLSSSVHQLPPWQERQGLLSWTLPSGQRCPAAGT